MTTRVNELEATRAANVALDAENAMLRQALRVIRKGLSDSADGEFWTARKWLDRRGIYHGDLTGERVLELVAKHALHGKIAADPLYEDGWRDALRALATATRKVLTSESVAMLVAALSEAAASPTPDTLKMFTDAKRDVDQLPDWLKATPDTREK